MRFYPRNSYYEMCSKVTEGFYKELVKNTQLFGLRVSASRGTNGIHGSVFSNHVATIATENVPDNELQASINVLLTVVPDSFWGKEANQPFYQLLIEKQKSLMPDPEPTETESPEIEEQEEIPPPKPRKKKAEPEE